MTEFASKQTRTVNLLRMGVLGLTALLLFLVMRNVRLYGDDFFYYQFAQNGLPYFLQRHIEHYFRANGRVVVHLLVSIFLYLPPVFWQLANALMLTGIAYCGGQIVSNTPQEKLRVTILLSSALFLLHITLTRQSVYWLTGSWNYVYPVFLFLAFWASLKKVQQSGKLSIWASILCLLSAASVEQVGMMTVGLVSLTLLDTILRKKKANRALILLLVIALIGCATVVFSPAVAVRASQEEMPVSGLWQLILYNLTYVVQMLSSPVGTPYVGLFLLALVWAIITAWVRKSDAFFVRVMITLLSVVLFAFWLYIKLKWKDSLLTFPQITSHKWVVLVSALLLALSVLWFLHWHYRQHRNPTFYIAVVLAVGAQLMMLISPVYGPRNFFCSIVVFLIFVAQFCLEPEHFPKIHYLLLTMLLCCSIVVHLGTYSGYHTNRSVYDSNRNTIAQFLQAPASAPQLSLYMLPLEAYGWAMPYHNPYYDVYYNLTYSLPPSTKILWQKP